MKIKLTLNGFHGYETHVVKAEIQENPNPDYGLKYQVKIAASAAERFGCNMKDCSCGEGMPEDFYMSQWQLDNERGHDSGELPPRLKKGIAMSLQIIQAKPNPAGKENEGAPTPARLLGEWVDIRNNGNEPIHFSTIQLRHTLFDEFSYATGPEIYWVGGVKEYLKPGQVLRVHAGSRSHAHLAAAKDQAGADWHEYAGGKSFVLNVRYGDKLSVSWRDASDQSFIDWVCYAPNPPEDAILKRSGNLLAIADAARLW